MSDLTNDEWTILLIAKQGQYLAPIGRWEKPVKSLAEKGLLQRLDSVNYAITPKGSEFADKQEDDELRGFLEAGIKARNGHEQARQSIEQAALHLSLAARASAATGDSPEVAAKRWSVVVLDRALELLDQQTDEPKAISLHPR